MIVTEPQVVQAMKFFEEKHIAANGPLDKVHLPKEMAQLANLLGAMWYSKEHEAQVPDTSKIAALLKEALHAVLQPEQAATVASPPSEAVDDHPLFRQDGRDEGDVICEACQ